MKIITMADQDRREKPEGLSLSGILSRVTVVAVMTVVVIAGNPTTVANRSASTADPGIEIDTDQMDRVG